MAKACSETKELSDAEVGIYWAYPQAQYFNMYRKEASVLVLMNGFEVTWRNLTDAMRSDVDPRD